MTTTTGCPYLNNYDPLSDAQLSDPFSVWQRARQECPVFFAPELNVWTATRYEDVVRILEDPVTFANGGTLGGTNVPDRYKERFPDGVWSNAALINRDGEDHKRAKRLAQKAFLPRNIKQMEPAVQQLADELLDPLVKRGHGDLFNEFAAPFTIGTITSFLGLPPEDARQIQQVTEDALVILTPGNDDGSNGEEPNWTEDQLQRFDRVVAFKDYLGTVIQQKRAEPDSGIISALVHAEIDGQRLSNDEVEGMVLEQMIAGNDTAANMIAHALYYLSKSPDMWNRVTNDYTLIPPLLEEVVRRHTPSKGLFRRATRDVMVGDIQIAKGQLIHVLWGSANTDETEFPNPLELELQRPNIDQHVGFGRGEHRCLGSLLAKLEGRVALESVFQRLKQIEITEEEPLSYAPALTNVSVLSLQARW